MKCFEGSLGSLAGLVVMLAQGIANLAGHLTKGIAWIVEAFGPGGSPVVRWIDAPHQPSGISQFAPVREPQQRIKQWSAADLRAAMADRQAQHDEPTLTGRMIDNARIVV